MTSQHVRALLGESILTASYGNRFIYEAKAGNFGRMRGWVWVSGEDGASSVHAQAFMPLLK